MPSFRGFSRNLLSRSKSSNSIPPATDNSHSNATVSPDPNVPTTNASDSPEGAATRTVRLFCESGSANNQGEEVLFLPTIVDSAESSPAAAAAAAYQIRKFLHKDNYPRPHVQYNAIMLLRILSENPGPSFTKNIDSKFVSTTANLLRQGKDPSVQQILRETLDALDLERYNDPGLGKLLEMWRSNRGFNTRHNYNHSMAAAMQASRQTSQAGPAGLPPQAELATRVEEAKNSAKILLQLVQSTPVEEVMNNDLVKEFAERCQGAQRSMQGYIGCENPAPDDDTLQTLIETSEQLSLSLSRHQRAVLNARRALGLSTSTGASPAPDQDTTQPLPPLPQQNGIRQESSSPNHLSSNSPPIQAIPSLAPEPRHQPSQFAPPSGPPLKAALGEESGQDPFSDNAEQSQFGAKPINGGSQNQVVHEQPRQPVTYRY